MIKIFGKTAKICSTCELLIGFINGLFVSLQKDTADNVDDKNIVEMAKDEYPILFIQK